MERPRAVSYLSRRVAVTEQGADRHHPSCSMQLLRQARDGDRVPSGIDESIVQSQRHLEYCPADRQHFLTLRGKGLIGIRRLTCQIPVCRAQAAVPL